MKGNKNSSEKEFIAALRKSGGWVSQTAKILGVSHQAVSARIRKNKKIKAIYEEIREAQLDLAELKVVNAVKAGKPWAICFYLKCQGKARGWVERAEITGKDGAPMNGKESKDIDLNMDPQEATRIYLENLKHG